MTSSPAYKMRLSLNVLQHLGLKLYSNVPAVLSEVVANAWDADARNVRVRFDKEAGCIVIQDDGAGMTRGEVNARFLLVGYTRRDDQKGKTPRGRLPMGRKGIGKLSLFSIANSIVVETTRDGEKSALQMRVDKIGEVIREGEGEYSPEALPVSGIDFEHGTRITLRELRKRQTVTTALALRKRLARRFSIIGSAHDFSVLVNGEQVTPEDRGYHDRLQYIWTYGDQSEVTNRCVNIEEVEERQHTVAVPEGPNLEISGWLGTVRESRHLQDENGENLNRIAIFVRGKMAQEDMLGDFAERGVYASYLLGELRVDGLDTDDGEDAATSSRQRIVEDDPRYVALRGLIGRELKYIQSSWSELRVEAGARKATEIPAVRSWIEQLPKQDSRRAKRWLGKLNRINIGSDVERRQLMKHAVLAFEFFRLNEDIERLETIDDRNIEAVIDIFRELDGLEENLYGQIVRQRMAVIKTMQEKVDRNNREKVIQKYLFKHLWLLDPSWERVESSELMEKRVSSLFSNIDNHLSDEEKAARLDIKYRKTAGKHVIIELKRPGRSVSVYDLSKQIQKYRSGMRKILDKRGIAMHEPVEFVCLLGKPPTEWEGPEGQRVVEDVLRVQNARYVTYDNLLENSYRAYQDYTKKKEIVNKIGEVIKAIDDYSEE